MNLAALCRDFLAARDPIIPQKATIMLSSHCQSRPLVVLNLLWLVVGTGVAGGAETRISQLNQHFNEPEKDTAPWMFIPESNIKSASTADHPGLVTIYEAGKGRDIKGVLKNPIKFDDYPVPWEFQTSLIQSFNGTAGVGAKTQINYAIGLNVAVTFSDPSTWPSDHSKRPPQTREFQLLVVHLGCTGEAGVGLPQFSVEPHPENYLVWGRGDLGDTVMGDWRIPYVWIGDGAKYAGPASPQLFFRCVVLGPTQLSVGIKFDASHGWNMRTIDCARLGKDYRNLGNRTDHFSRPLDSRRALPQLAADQRTASVVLGQCRCKSPSAGHDGGDCPASRASQSALRILRRLLRLLRCQSTSVRGVFR